MQKILITKPGGLNALEIVEEADPSPPPMHYRVRVHAAGVNFADTIIRQGLYAAANGKYPLTPGFEFAGVIDAKGQGADEFEIGDRVFGFTLFGGYASVQIAQAGHMQRIPPNWSFAQAAALPAAHLTAFHALQNAAHVRARETVLVHSAAGGVGLALVQQAKILGCNVIGVVGHVSKTAVVAQAGAHHVVLKNKRLWQALDALAPAGFDAVFDANGVTTLKPAFKRLRSGGRLVVYGFAELLPRGRKVFWPQLALNWLRIPRFSPFGMTATNRSLIGLNLAFLTERGDLASIAMAAIANGAATGKISHVPVTGFAFEEAAKAHKLIESGQSVGKIILTFAPKF